MSRSTDLGVTSRVGRVTAPLIAGTLVAVTLVMPPARADPPPDPPAEAPVVMITAPVVDLHAGTSDLDGTVAVEERDNGGTAARLDSEVLFAKDSARLRPDARETIRNLVKQLRPGGPGKITVTGHTDDLGSAAHGLRLSKRRAVAVADLLQTLLGPEWPAINTVGKGEADPAVPNTSEKNRRLNRRVIVTVKR